MSTDHEPRGADVDHRTAPDRARAGRVMRLLAVHPPLAAASAFVVTGVLNTVAVLHALPIKYPDNGGD